jgi:hypothetical protein
MHIGDIYCLQILVRFNRVGIVQGALLLGRVILEILELLHFYQIELVCFPQEGALPVRSDLRLI